MKRLLAIIGPAILGLVIVLVGFAYDLFFAGIPYQDPMPELQARWELNKSIAEKFHLVGGIVFLLGVIAIPVLWIVTRKKPEVSR